MTSQDSSHPWAKAGVILKESPSNGSRYVAMMLTPGYGVRLEANYTTDIDGRSGGGPPLAQAHPIGQLPSPGTSRPDGVTWSQVGAVALDGLPPTVEVGLFVSSPFNIGFVQGAGEAGLQRRCDRRARRVRPCPPWSRRPPADWVYLKVTPEPVPGRTATAAGARRDD